MTEEEAGTIDAFLPSIRRFGAGLDALAYDRAHRLPAEVIAEAAELGLFGLMLPAEHGGAGLGLAATATILAELAQHDRALGTTLGLHAGLGTRALVWWGSEAARARWLPPLARGQVIAAFAATEAEAGSHVAGVKTTLRPHATGDGRWVLDGDKVFVTNGGLAGLVTVLARDPAGTQESLVLVPRGSPGVIVGAEEQKLGLRASSTTGIRFDGVVLEPDARLPTDGLEGLHEVLAHGRTLMAAGCLGTARKALALAVAHTATRRQFGRELMRIGLVRQRRATMATRVFALEGAVQFTAGLADRGAPTFGPVSGALKVLASETAWDVADDAVQLFGGMGFIEPTGAAILLRDARITRVFEGANDVLRVQLGLDVWRTRAAILPPEVAGSVAYAHRAEALAQATARIATPSPFARQGPLVALADAALAQLAYLGGLVAAAPGGRDAARLALLEATTGEHFEAALGRLDTTRSAELDALYSAVSDGLTEIA